MEMACGADPAGDGDTAWWSLRLGVLSPLPWLPLLLLLPCRACRCEALRKEARSERCNGCSSPLELPMPPVDATCRVACAVDGDAAVRPLAVVRGGGEAVRAAPGGGGGVEGERAGVAWRDPTEAADALRCAVRVPLPPRAPERLAEGARPPPPLLLWGPRERAAADERWLAPLRCDDALDEFRERALELTMAALGAAPAPAPTPAEGEAAARTGGKASSVAASAVAGAKAAAANHERSGAGRINDTMASSAPAGDGLAVAPPWSRPLRSV